MLDEGEGGSAIGRLAFNYLRIRDRIAMSRRLGIRIQRRLGSVAAALTDFGIKSPCRIS